MACAHAKKTRLIENPPRNIKDAMDLLKKV
jgi:hypothetical protein